MYNIGNIEDITINLKCAIKTLELMNNLFENKLDEEYAEIIKEHRNIFNELRNFTLISQLLNKHMQNICNDYQNQINEYYKDRTFEII